MSRNRLRWVSVHPADLLMLLGLLIIPLHIEGLRICGDLPQGNQPLNTQYHIVIRYVDHEKVVGHGVGTHRHCQLWNIPGTLHHLRSWD